MTADDFDFRAGRAGDPGTWPLAPAPSAVTLLPTDLGATTHRYAVTWPDGAIKNTWLQVTVKANERTGLARPDVFSFGNLVGETGDGSGALPLRVTAMDLAAVRRNTFSAAPITSRYDFNRDGRVNALDVVAVRSNLGQTLAPFGATPVIAAAERRTVGREVLTTA